MIQGCPDNGLANNTFPNHLGGMWIPTLSNVIKLFSEICFPVIIPGFCFGYD